MTVVFESVTLAAIYSLFAVGLSLAWGVGKVLNLAHGAVFTAAGLVIYKLTEHSGKPLWLLVICAAMAGALITLLLDAVFFRHIRLHGGTGGRAELGQMVASLGAGVAVVAYCLNESGKRAQPLPAGISTARSYVWFGARVQLIDVEIIAVTVVISVALMLAVKRSGFGRSLRAVAFDAEASEILGIDAQLITGATMAISGAIAGVGAALLSAQTLGYDQQLGNQFIFKGFAIVVLGGPGSIAGTLLGAVVLGFSEILTATYIDQTWVDSVAFILIVVLLMLRPGGLLRTANFVRG